MCFKKLFAPDKHYAKTALLFAINDYPGSANDLRGCLNDQAAIKSFLKSYYPEFHVYEYKNKQVTTFRFLEKLAYHVERLSAGEFLFVSYSGHGTQGIDPHHREEDGYSEALYLYDGSLWDYEIAEILQLVPEGATVVISFDSCFSGGSATRMNSYRKERYVETQEIKPQVRKRQSMLKDVSHKFILFAGCQEDQVSMDAWIGDRYCGAFTYFWLASYDIDYTYQSWIDRTIAAINEFEQIPMLIGNDNIKNKKIFT